MDQTVHPRPASTVMLVRDGSSGIEVFVLRRVRAMAFAGGVTAFPGGGVDDRDAAPIPFIGLPVSWWADRLQVAPGKAAALVVAAVRELFEETGVLLGSAAVPPDLERWRLAVTDHRVGLAEVLTDLEMSADFDALVPWSRWITPAGGPRRYDTFFFVAALPEGQQASLTTTEAEVGEWVAPAVLIDQHRQGQRRLMAPTLANLTDLAGSTSVAQLLAAERPMKPVEPVRVSGTGEPLRVSIDGKEVPAE